MGQLSGLVEEVFLVREASPPQSVMSRRIHSRCAE